jgi:adenosine deaminase
MDIDINTLHALPKVDLHCHLDGSLRVETLIDLAKQQHVQLPSDDPKTLKKILASPGVKRPLNEYLKAFDTTLSVLQRADALRRVAYELTEDAAKENTRYLEVRFSPVLHTNNGLSMPRIMEAVLHGLEEGERAFNIRTGVIICGMRNINPETSLKLAELAVTYKGAGVVGFDLAGQEESYPAKKHLQAFYLIRNNHVNCTAHAGEAFGPESIRQAVHYLNAHRIGHGTRLHEDGDLMNYINDHRIPLEMCVTSNVDVGSVVDYASHPLRYYYEFGIRVTINTDNRLISDTTLTREYQLVMQHLGLSLMDIKHIIIHGFKSAFLPIREKRELLNRIMLELGFTPSPFPSFAEKGSSS